MSLQRITCEGASGEELIHVCDPCEHENGRVRGVALIDPSYDYQTLIAKLKGNASEQAAAATLFETAIGQGKIHLISETNGTFDGGSPQTGDGYGDEENRLLGYLYTLAFKDPSYSGNKDFWQRAEKEHWIPMWRTETLLHFADKPASVQAIAPVEADLTSAVAWNVTNTWKSKNKPEIAPLAPLARFFEGCWERINHVASIEITGVTGDEARFTYAGVDESVQGYHHAWANSLESWLTASRDPEVGDTAYDVNGEGSQNTTVSAVHLEY